MYITVKFLSLKTKTIVSFGYVQDPFLHRFVYVNNKTHVIMYSPLD